jgi:hypothetical protein
MAIRKLSSNRQKRYRQWRRRQRLRKKTEAIWRVCIIMVAAF